MKTTLLLLMMCMAVVGQSKDELRKKYREPVSETFVVRPGIIATASYSSTGQVTELLIAPQLTDLIKSKSKGLSYETLKAVIDELVPTSVRGRGLLGGFANIACMPQNDCYGSFESYEKLIIYYNAGRHGDVNYAVVQWKN